MLFDVSPTLADDALLPIARELFHKLRDKYVVQFADELRRELLKLTVEFMWQADPKLGSYRLVIHVTEPKP